MWKVQLISKYYVRYLFVANCMHVRVAIIEQTYFD